MKKINISNLSEVFGAAPERNSNELHKIIKDQIKLIKPEKEIIDSLKKLSGEFIGVLNKELATGKINAEAFIGGSFARDTLIKGKTYDVDIFVRFDWRYENISPMLENVLKKACKETNLKLEKIHGSRDYFRVHSDGNRGYLEIVPVTKIKKPQEERNVTDLSYFHVPYVKRKIKGLEDQVRVAKLFCKAQKVYGAETYVKGFSGYTLELLVIYYKSFVKMLRELMKVKSDERLVIDIEKHYKKRDEVFIHMNESKLHSPVILIDPTYKERNALAALSRETFEKFQESAGRFLKSPSKKFFEPQEIDVEKMIAEAKRKNAEFLRVEIETDKQEGDIAGTKLKKFAGTLTDELDKYFFAARKEFEYNGMKKADLYLILKSRKEVVRIGPPLHLKKFVNAFKKEHMDTYEKNGIIHARIKINFTARSYIDVWVKANRKMVGDMGIVRVGVLG